MISILPGSWLLYMLWLSNHQKWTWLSKKKVVVICGHYDSCRTGRQSMVASLFSCQSFSACCTWSTGSKYMEVAMPLYECCVVRVCVALKLGARHCAQHCQSMPNPAGCEGCNVKVSQGIIRILSGRWPIYILWLINHQKWTWVSKKRVVVCGHYDRCRTGRQSVVAYLLSC